MKKMITQEENNVVYVVVSYTALTPEERLKVLFGPNEIAIKFHGAYFSYKEAQKQLGNIRSHFIKNVFIMPVYIQDFDQVYEKAKQEGRSEMRLHYEP